MFHLFHWLAQPSNHHQIMRKVFSRGVVLLKSSKPKPTKPDVDWTIKYANEQVEKVKNYPGLNRGQFDTQPLPPLQSSANSTPPKIIQKNTYNITVNQQPDDTAPVEKKDKESDAEMKVLMKYAPFIGEILGAVVRAVMEAFIGGKRRKW